MVTATTMGPELVAAAAALVRERIATARRNHLPIPDSAGDRARLEARIGKAVEAGNAVAVVDEGVLAGFLAWMSIPLWGDDGVFVAEWGHGWTDASLIPHLHALAAQRWATDGRFVHAITLWADAPAVEAAWHHAGFGRVLIDAVRTTDPLPAVPPGLVAYRAETDDAPVLANLECRLHEHLAAAPVFRVHPPPEGVDAMARRLGEPTRPMWVAGTGDAIRGYISIAGGEDVPPSLRDDSTARCDGMYVDTSSRRHGYGRALVAAALGWARESGVRRIALDYETANHEASTFWPALGWTPVLVTVSRRVAGDAVREA